MNTRGIAFAALVILGGCLPKIDMTSIETAVTTFHQRQSQGQDDVIYREASQEFRDSASLDDLKRIQLAARTAMQRCQPPVRNPAEFNFTSSTSGLFVSVVYDSHCDNGDLQEQFRFRFEEGSPRLVSYNVSGMALFPAAPATEATGTATTNTTATTAKAPPTSPATTSSTP